MKKNKMIKFLNGLSKEQLERFIKFGYKFVIENGRITEVIK